MTTTIEPPTGLGIATEDGLGSAFDSGLDSGLETGPATTTAEIAPIAVRRKRGRPRDPEADARILEAAAGLMLAVGYESMTVDDVAAAARVGKATVYRRFAKKEELAVAAMRRLYEAEMPIPDTGSLRGDLTEVVKSVLEFANSAAGGAYLRTAVSESARDPRIAALYRAANAEAEAASRTIYERAIARGEMRPDVNMGLATQLVSGVLLVRTVTGTPMPRPDEAGDMIELVLRGLSR